MVFALLTVLAVVQTGPSQKSLKMPRDLGLPHQVMGLEGPGGLIVSRFATNGLRSRRNRFELGGEPEMRVLFYGIGAPKPGDPTYPAAMQRLEIWTRGGAPEAFLEPEPSDPEKRHRGSAVRYVWLWGKLLNRELLLLGLAELRPEGRSGKYGVELAAAEATARRRRVGQWATTSR